MSVSGLWAQMPEAAQRRTSVENVRDVIEALAERFFPVEYLERKDDGPSLHRVALRNWPEWAAELTSAIQRGREIAQQNLLQAAEEARGAGAPSDEPITETSQQICRLLLGDARKVDADIIESHIRALLSRAAPSGQIVGFQTPAGSLIDAEEAGYLGIDTATCRALTYAATQPSAPVVAWVRFCSDGGIEGPILDNDRRMDDARRKSGTWTPLGVIGPQPSARQSEPVCRGDARLGTACGKCARCKAEQPPEEARGVDAELLDYAMQIAHERELEVTGHKHDSEGAVRRFRSAAKRLLAAPAAATAQEPVFYADAGTVRALANPANGNKSATIGIRRDEAVFPSDVPLYTAPQAATGAQGLTDEQAEAIEWAIRCAQALPAPMREKQLRAILDQAAPASLHAESVKEDAESLQGAGAPERIYLIVGGDAHGGDFNWLDALWCAARQYDTDIEYVRADLAASKEA